jgi:gamma-glutamyltranspeptidase/glutathione hydrolase
VPSEVRGLQYLHNKHGVLPWSTVLQPAIKTARDGFPMTEDLYHATQRTLKNGKDFLVTDPSWAQDFAPHGTILGLGDTLYRKRYADTLETIANEGPEAFYTGRIAETMIDAVRATNGIMTLEDLQNYKVAIRDTPQINYRGYTVTSTSAPSAGVIGLSILKIIDGYERFFSPESIQLSTHRLDEAMRFAYGQVRFRSWA